MDSMHAGDRRRNAHKLSSLAITLASSQVKAQLVVRKKPVPLSIFPSALVLFSFLTIAAIQPYPGTMATLLIFSREIRDMILGYCMV